MKVSFLLKVALFFIIIKIIAVNGYSQDYNLKFEKLEEFGGVEEYLYTPNGLSILLVQDNSAPVVTVQMEYRVGSKHEVTGNTGSAHLLEHLMFKGTPTFNKDNGNAIFNVLQGMGAQMNATTWNDRTNYYETIPSDKIETAIHIEADRMRNSLLLKEDKDAEMTVVRNEFERGENNPTQVLNKEIWAAAYLAHPYYHSTIGWRSDIENMPIEVLRDFYNTYYWPDNATLTIIGDFQEDNLFKLIDTYFGVITKSPNRIPQPYTEEPVQFGPRRVTVKKSGQQGLLTIGYKIPGRLHDDLPALKVLSEILGKGALSIINKTLVNNGKALSGYANVSEFNEVGLFTMSFGFSPDKRHEDIYAEMLNLVEKVKAEGVLQEDINRILNKLYIQSILSRDGSGSIARQLTEAIAGGDWKDYINETERLSKVTASDVNRVAVAYLKEDQSTTGYFVPQTLGSNKPSNLESTKFILDAGKYFYRTPGINYLDTSNSLNIKASDMSTDKMNISYGSFENGDSKTKFERKKIGGIDVISVKTNANDLITVNASFSIANYFNIDNNEEIPNLTTQMLSKGTIKNDKLKFAEKLEEFGVLLKVNSSKSSINISFMCLKKDIKSVLGLLAEELEFPLFDAQEFALLKTQIINGLKQNLLDPASQGSIALSQNLYYKGHPNYRVDTEEAIKNIEVITLEDLKLFHKTYFGSSDMHLVAVGDVDSLELYRSINNTFKSWKSGTPIKSNAPKLGKINSITKVITIPQKSIANMYIGQYTGIERSHLDFIPLFIGTNVLGGGFSGRLMQTVRDRDGLTYGIFARHSGDINSGGYWNVQATFNPSLFQKGLDGTLFEINKWVIDGISDKELATNKTNIIGSFKVGMATTSGLARTILNFVEQGLDPSYIDQYTKDIDIVTLEQVNDAIRKYIHLDKLVIIKSGSLDDSGQPLN